MSVREQIISLFEKIIVGKAYSNILLKNELEKNELDDRDKRLITEIVYGTVRHLITIDRRIEYMTKRKINEINMYLLNILRTSIYQIDYLDRIPDYSIVNEAVELAKKKSLSASKFINGVLRNYLREKDSISFEFDNKIEEYSYKYSFNEYIVKTLTKQYGDYLAENIMKNLNKRPSLTVRVNNILSNMDQVCENLKEEGYDFEKGEVNNSIIIRKSGSIEKNDLYKKGIISVQDQSAMVVCEIVNPKQNDRILDVCSAPGGKSVYLAEMQKDKGEIYACDLHEFKLNLIENNAKRHGIESIKTVHQDGKKIRKDFFDKFDKVLVDAPCSGMGIVSKKPEIKYFKNRDEVKEIIKIQKEIINNVAKYVRIEGELIYSTCTINKFENEAIVNNFLETNDNFIIEAIEDYEEDNFIFSDEGFLTILPGNDMDGFFVAKLRRVK